MEEMMGRVVCFFGGGRGWNPEGTGGFFGAL